MDDFYLSQATRASLSIIEGVKMGLNRCDSGVERERKSRLRAHFRALLRVVAHCGTPGGLRLRRRTRDRAGQGGTRCESKLSEASEEIASRKTAPWAMGNRGDIGRGEGQVSRSRSRVDGSPLGERSRGEVKVKSGMGVF